MTEPIRISISISSSLQDVIGVDVAELGKNLQAYAESLVVTNKSIKSAHPTVVNTYVTVNESIAPTK